MDTTHSKIIQLSKYSYRDSSARRRCRKLVKLERAELVGMHRGIIFYRVPATFIIYPK